MKRGVLAGVLVLGFVVATPIPGHATATTSGEGFDTCTALPTSAMRSLDGGAYSTANVYIGGVNRACAQPELSARWVATVTGAGWTLIPTYLGKQAPCALGWRRHRGWHHQRHQPAGSLDTARRR